MIRPPPVTECNLQAGVTSGSSDNRLDGSSFDDSSGCDSSWVDGTDCDKWSGGTDYDKWDYHTWGGSWDYDNWGYDKNWSASWATTSGATTSGASTSGATTSGATDMPKDFGLGLRPGHNAEALQLLF